MFTFIACLCLLVVGYFTYGKYVSRVFGADETKVTPSMRMADGVDYVPLGTFRSLFIQFLNVVGIGPIFGAILGAAFGPMAFLWILFGCIFAGAVHDFFSGMLSVRADGATVGEIVGENLGEFAREVMRVFSVILLMLVGVVFLMSPAKILSNLTGGAVSVNVLLVIIILYYILATMLPIDKLIARLYPLFGLALFFMAVGISLALIIGDIRGYYHIPEITELATKVNWNSKLSLFPFLFITIACGAISGFHATQSPIIARCIKTEKDGSRVFYLAMIGEGIVATIWAAAAMTLFPATPGDPSLASHLQGLAAAGSAPVVVNKVAVLTLGKVGAILAVLGVVAAPITSGDTAFRGARITLADIFKLDQRPIKNRYMLAIPIFIVAIILTQVDFGIIWRYFAWSNQTLACIGLWSATAWLVRRNKNHLITMLPAMFMTVVCVDYILIDHKGFGILFDKIPNGELVGLIIGIIVAIIGMIVTYKTKAKFTEKGFIKD